MQLMKYILTELDVSPLSNTQMIFDASEIFSNTHYLFHCHALLLPNVLQCDVG